MAKGWDLGSLAAYLDPLDLARYVYIRSRRGWSQFQRAPGPNARFFITTSFLWTIPLALTNPYKPLYLSHLGLSRLAIGGFYALEMGSRVLGVLLGAGLATRFGHKKVLIWGDVLSWIVPTAILALATEPWHAFVATVLYATNSLVNAPVQQLMLEDTPESRRSNTFGLMNLVGNLPAVLLPAAVGLAVAHWSLMPVLRLLFGFQLLCMLGGILWRAGSLKESSATRSSAGIEELLQGYVRAARHLLGHPAAKAVLPAFILANIMGNLWQGYFGLYAVQGLGLPEEVVGQATQVRSILFVGGSLLLVPPMARLEPSRSLVWLSALTGLAPALLLLHPGRSALLWLNALGGLAAAPFSAIFSVRLSSLLPKGMEGLAHSLCTALMLACLALGFTLTGALFETRFNLFPWICLAAVALQTLLAAQASGLNRA